MIARMEYMDQNMHNLFIFGFIHQCKFCPIWSQVDKKGKISKNIT